MRVFVLSTTRSATTTFVRACSHLTNYTVGHETNWHIIGPSRFKYPDNHIEVDGLLHRTLGRIDDLYGDSAFYVHLIRDRTETAESLNTNKFEFSSFKNASFNGSRPVENPDSLTMVNRCEDYYDLAHDNIRLFLKDKTNKMVFRVESAITDCRIFFELIGAKGDLDAGLSEWLVKHNEAKERQSPSFFLFYRRKIIWKLIKILKQLG